jgi:hypothetical protein
VALLHEVGGCGLVHCRPLIPIVMPAKAGIQSFEVFAWDRAAAAYWIVRPV